MKAERAFCFFFPPTRISRTWIVGCREKGYTRTRCPSQEKHIHILSDGTTRRLLHRSTAHSCRKGNVRQAEVNRFFRKGILLLQIKSFHWLLFHVLSRCMHLFVCIKTNSVQRQLIMTIMHPHCTTCRRSQGLCIPHFAGLLNNN